MPQRERYQTRLAPDHADAVDAYADDHDLTHAEAVRRLIVAGLDAERHPTTDEIAADLRSLRAEIEEEEEQEEPAETHVMEQMGTGRIAALAVGIAVAGLAVTQLPLAATYTVAAAVGTLLVAYGAAPLLAT